MFVVQHWIEDNLFWSLPKGDWQEGLPSATVFMTFGAIDSVFFERQQFFPYRIRQLHIEFTIIGDPIER